MFENVLSNVLRMLGSKVDTSIYTSFGNMVILTDTGKKYVNDIIEREDFYCKTCGENLVVCQQSDIIPCSPFLSCLGQIQCQVSHDVGYSLFVDPEKKVMPIIIEDTE